MRQTPEFEIRSKLERQPFRLSSYLSFFETWCEIHAPILPIIISRRQWQQKWPEILETDPADFQVLYLPGDLQIWEMVRVLEVIDRQTFPDQPEKQSAAAEKLRAQGQLWQAAGIYLAQHLKKISDGAALAEKLALELYDAGSTLVSDVRPPETLTIEQLAELTFPTTEIEAVESFLLGKNLYQSRQQRVSQKTLADPGQAEELAEAERQRTINQFFRVAAKAVALERQTWPERTKNPLYRLKPWQNPEPVHSVFLEKVDQNLTGQLELPLRELNGAIFRRGREKLVREMAVERWDDLTTQFLNVMGVKFSPEKTRIAEAIHLDELKAELATTRAEGNPAFISYKERLITTIIQAVLLSLPKRNTANNPAQMLTDYHINCVGASLLGGALMAEAGLNYLVGDVPEHSVLILITADGGVEWRDMLDFNANQPLTDKIIQGQASDGTSLRVRDIVEFSRQPTESGLRFNISDPRFKAKTGIVRSTGKLYLGLYNPEYGERIQILSNLGAMLSEANRKQAAVGAYSEVVAQNPKFSYPFHGLGAVLNEIGRHEEAVALYLRAIAIDQQFADAYYGLGVALFDMGKLTEAVQVLKQVLSIDVNFMQAHYSLGSIYTQLGATTEAINSYQHFINQADRIKYASYIWDAQQTIKILSRPVV